MVTRHLFSVEKSSSESEDDALFDPGDDHYSPEVETDSSEVFVDASETIFIHIYSGFGKLLPARSWILWKLGLAHTSSWLTIEDSFFVCSNCG